MKKRIYGITTGFFLAGIIIGVAYTVVYTGMLTPGLFISSFLTASISPAGVSDDCAEAWNYMVDTYPPFPLHTDAEELCNQESENYNASFCNDYQRLNSICSEEELERIDEEVERVIELQLFNKKTGLFII